MSRNSQSSFPPSVRNYFLDTYGSRCVLCLAYLPPNGAHCAHIIDQSMTTGRQQVRMNSNTDMFVLNIYIYQLVEAQRLGLLQGDFQRGSSDNGILRTYSSS